jgi:drug/metabolite transporter (DMT)-like permease
MTGKQAACGTAIAWGVEPLFLGVCLEHTSPSNLSFLRVLLGGVFLSIFISRKRDIFKNISRRQLGLMLLSGLALSANYYGFIEGIGSLGPSAAAVLLQTGPLFLLVFCFCFFGERINRTQFVGVITAAFGFYLFYDDRAAHSQQEDVLTGVLWVLGAALAWACFALLQRLASRDSSPEVATLIAFGSALLCLSPQAEMIPLSTPLFIALLISGLLSFLAYLFLALALKRGPGPVVSIILVLNPLITLFLSVVCFEIGIGSANLHFPGAVGCIGVALAIAGSAVFVSQGDDFPPAHLEEVV